MEKKIQKKIVSFKIQFIDSARSMTRLLPNFVDILGKEVHKIKCKYGHDDKNCEAGGIKYKDFECCLVYINVKNDLILYKGLCCNCNYQKELDQNLKKRFANSYKCSKHDVNKFILFWLRRSVAPYEYMDDR